MNKFNPTKAARFIPCALALASPGCLEEDLFIMTRVHQVADAEDVPSGYGCTNVGSNGSGSSGGGDETVDWWERQTTSSDGLHVVVGSFDQVLEDRHYDRDFVRALEVDRFVVTTREGNRYAYTIWGGVECEPCPPDAYEPLPGDASGCDGGAEGGSDLDATSSDSL